MLGDIMKILAAWHYYIPKMVAVFDYDHFLSVFLHGSFYAA